MQGMAGAEGQGPRLGVGQAAGAAVFPRQGPGWEFKRTSQWESSGMCARGPCRHSAPPDGGSTPRTVPQPPEGTKPLQARLEAGAARDERRKTGMQTRLKPPINSVARGESPHLLAGFLLCTALITIQPR